MAQESDNTQLDKFKQAARDLECNESEDAFAQKLKKVAKPAENAAKE